MSTADLAFDDVRLDLGGRTILREATFRVAPGEFVGVLGANGSGKTTLMRAVLGLVRPCAGRISLGGEAVGRGQTAIGYMPQVRAMPATRLTGRDFIAAAWGGARWGLPRTTAAGRAEIARVLALVQAEALADRPIAALSGGERQRLLLAQALLGQPTLLLLDEPLASLDPRHAAGVVAVVRRLQRALGLTVLFSAHDLNPLLGAMDRVLTLRDGRAALGTEAEMVTGPVLSALYGASMDVVRASGRVFVAVAVA